MTDRIATSPADKWAWLRAVCVHPDRTLAVLAVAVAVAHHFNAKHGAAWPASRTISDWCGLDRRNVRRAIAALEGAGLLAILERGGPRRATRYALVMGAHGQPQRAPTGALSGRSLTPSAGAPGRPELLGSVSETELIHYSAANAPGSGCADAAPPPHARGGQAGQSTKPRRRRAARAAAPIAF
jgi:hypothetical protein